MDLSRRDMLSYLGLPAGGALLSLWPTSPGRAVAPPGPGPGDCGESIPDGFDIRGYGARSEARDNYEAVMAAVEAAHGAGGTVVVPEGEYRYGRTLDLVTYDRASLRGSNKLASRLVFDGDGTAVRFASQAAVFSSFTLRAGRGDHRYGFANDPEAGGGAQDTYHENVRVEGFSQGAGWLLRNAWEHTFIRCDALRCRDGYVLGSRNEPQVANDITLHSCNSRQHSGIALDVARTSGAITAVGGNYAAAKVGVRVGNTYGVTLLGTYHEANTCCDVHLTHTARGSRVFPSYSDSPVGVLVEGVDGEIGGGSFQNPEAAIQIGTSVNRARCFTIHRHYYGGRGHDVVVRAGSQLLRFDRAVDSEMPSAREGSPRSGNRTTDRIIEANRDRIKALEKIVRQFGLLESL